MTNLYNDKAEVIYTIAQCAKILNCAAPQVLYLQRRGKFNFHEIHGKKYIAEADIEQYLKEKLEKAEKAVEILLAPLPEKQDHLILENHIHLGHENVLERSTA